MSVAHDARPARKPAVFGILRTLDGFDVIANDTGRPVAHRETAQSANGVAYTLNRAAEAGPRALAAALGCGRKAAA